MFNDFLFINSNFFTKREGVSLEDLVYLYHIPTCPATWPEQEIVSCFTPIVVDTLKSLNKNIIDNFVVGNYCLITLS